MIVTVTPNPSIDRTVTLPAQLTRGAVHRVTSVTNQAGGKGVNVARALTLAGVDTLAVLPAAANDPLITALQISQFIWGTVINVIAAASWAMPGVGCAIQLPILQIGAAMYIAYGLLFARLFVERYSRKAEGDGAKNGSNGAHHANGNGASLEPPGLKAV